MQNPTEGMTTNAVRIMSVDELLDMDYFFPEDDKIEIAETYYNHRTVSLQELFQKAMRSINTVRLLNKKIYILPPTC